LVIALSKENEPSNEAWMGPLSVFTYNLCSAVQDEASSGGRILLQSCFERARQGTVEWSSSRLLSQTPSIIDGTNGRFYLS
jgi:hypothetical protein